MSYPALEKAEKEIAEGKLGIARDRLHGLVVAYPKDMSLRSRLGDVYSMLGYPIEAGRFWFLDEDLTDEKREAIALFIKSCNNDASNILTRLKIRYDPNYLTSEAAGEKVNELIEECKKRGIPTPDFKSSYNPGSRYQQPSLKRQLLTVGCVTLITVTIVLIIIGAKTAFEWIF